MEPLLGVRRPRGAPAPATARTPTPSDPRARLALPGERYRALVEGMHDGVILHDREGRILACNPAAERILGLRTGELDGAGADVALGKVVREDGTEWPVAQLPAVEVLATGRPVHGLVMGVLRPTGTQWLRLSAEPSWLDVPGVGAPDAAVVTFSDITEVMATQQELREAEERFRLAFEHSPLGTALVSPDGRLTRLNARLAELTGAARDELVGTALIDLVAEEDQGVVLRLLAEAADADVPSAAVDVQLGEVDGRQVHAGITASAVREADGTVRYLIVQVEDVTARRLAQAALAHQATHDALTGLPNRTLLLDRLAQATARAAREGRPVALLMCDIDRFKRINDSLGHEIGDLLLIEVGRRLQGTVRAVDTAGRLGGDEFLIVCEGMRDPADALHLADRLREATAQPFRIGDQRLQVTVSIGIAFARAGEEPSMLLRQADTAMYEAKEQGRDRYEVFDEALRDRARARLRLENELRSAVAGGQLVLHHQPVVDLATTAVVGHEVLVRWNHPTRGLLQPGTFLDVAEESGLIADIGTWVLAEACRQRPVAPTYMAVNVSARQLERAEFRQEVEEALAASDMPPERLVLELTESSLLRATRATLADVDALTRQGVRLAVDDFGTGYSSLTYLQKLPVSVVKIDRSFVAGITEDRTRTAITEAVLALGRALDLHIIAEGVETEEQARALRDLGCGYAQGYLFGRPAPRPASQAA